MNPYVSHLKGKTKLKIQCPDCLNKHTSLISNSYRVLTPSLSQNPCSLCINNPIHSQIAQFTLNNKPNLITPRTLSLPSTDHYTSIEQLSYSSNNLTSSMNSPSTIFPTQHPYEVDYNSYETSRYIIYCNHCANSFKLKLTSSITSSTTIKLLYNPCQHCDSHPTFTFQSNRNRHHIHSLLPHSSPSITSFLKKKTKMKISFTQPTTNHNNNI